MEHGDDCVITFGELKQLASGKDKSILQKLYLVIESVDSNEVELEEVIKQLKLDNQYNKAKKMFGVDELDCNSVDDFVAECLEEELKKSLQDNDLYSIVSDSVIYLYKDKVISDTKLRVLLDIVGLDLFEYLSDTHR